MSEPVQLRDLLPLTDMQDRLDELNKGQWNGDFDANFVFAILLLNEEIHLTTRQWLCFTSDVPQPKTVVAHVPHGGMRSYPDFVEVTMDELGTLWKFWLEDRRWGSTKWAAIKTGKAPVGREQQMRDEGAWCERMEALKGSANV